MKSGDEEMERGEAEVLVGGVERVVAEMLQGQGAGHGLDHVRRVVGMARRIQSRVGGDVLIVELAAWLHDVGDAKFHQGIERSGELSRRILEELSVAGPIVDEVVAIVDNISFRKRASAKPLSWEGKIVQDADRLDALGAIGIVRTIEYGASLGRPFAPASGSPSIGAGGEIEDPPSGIPPPPVIYGIDHFEEKLFQLRGLLHTAYAQEIATEREAFMRLFLAEYQREVEASS